MFLYNWFRKLRHRDIPVSGSPLKMNHRIDMRVQVTPNSSTYLARLTEPYGVWSVRFKGIQGTSGVRVDLSDGNGKVIDWGSSNWVRNVGGIRDQECYESSPVQTQIHRGTLWRDLWAGWRDEERQWSDTRCPHLPYWRRVDTSRWRSDHGSGSSIVSEVTLTDWSWVVEKRTFVLCHPRARWHNQVLYPLTRFIRVQEKGSDSLEVSVKQDHRT